MILIQQDTLEHSRSSYLSSMWVQLPLTSIDVLLMFVSGSQWSIMAVQARAVLTGTIIMSLAL